MFDQPSLRTRPVIASILFALLTALPWAPAVSAAPAPRVAPAIQRAATADPEARVVAWVRFTDRAGAERSPDPARAQLSERALRRRALRGSVAGVVPADLAVHAPYVRALAERGARVRGTSRWLNAASVEMPAGLAEALARLPFVASIEPVPVANRLRPVGAPEPEPPAAAGDAFSAVPSRVELAPGDTAWYGGAFKQLAMMQVPQLHAAGISGAGVLVCILDSGFRTTHQAFGSLDVLATRDFINGDTNVDDQAGQDVSGQGSHGTMTLACVAGLLPGTYAGGAFGATVALGKTEYLPTETPVEMDYWQFGAEWADSLGADVLSSSLGYYAFDSPWPSYTYADMDGRTTVVTQAAVEAMRRGITVVNSAGNEAATPWHYIIAPADADTVLSIGAVDSFNVVTSFSSRGPTADGRTKPDVTAMGRRVLVPSFGSTTTYDRVSGTSFSCPLTAGVVALLLESHPAWGPWEVREALRSTALNHATPDNDIGWGLVQAAAAEAWSSPLAVPAPPAVPSRGTGLALAATPNPFRAGATLAVRFASPRGEWARVEVLDLSGRSVSGLFEAPSPGEGVVRWDGRGADGSAMPAGLYWVRLRAASGTSAVRVALLR